MRGASPGTHTQPPSQPQRTMLEPLASPGWRGGAHAFMVLLLGSCRCFQHPGQGASGGGHASRGDSPHVLRTPIPPCVDHRIVPAPSMRSARAAFSRPSAPSPLPCTWSGPASSRGAPGSVLGSPRSPPPTLIFLLTLAPLLLLPLVSHPASPPSCAFGGLSGACLSFQPPRPARGWACRSQKH